MKFVAGAPLSAMAGGASFWKGGHALQTLPFWKNIRFWLVVVAVELVLVAVFAPELYVQAFQIITLIFSPIAQVVQLLGGH